MDIPVMQDILGRNDEIASKNKALFDKHGILAINLLGSPGSGKTTLLERTIAHLKDDLNLAVIEGDLFTDKDADRIAQHNVPVIQINTNGGCHLDAPMVEEVLGDLDLDKLDVVIIENVGNLVCPAEFVVGEDMKVTVLSITEGDDKPLKYPIIFKESKVAILNKVDILPFTNFDMESAKHDLKCIHPQLEIMETAASKDMGVDKWCDFIHSEFKKKQEQLKIGE
ncbi:hydrogenase nickel incorporation protein HypB [uncultured Megamonas sp.]|uniref:hydrogenase nickel incorporation protein HypB n=1 Tax=uncultured Megamonas sp. TaxID=286140 RepID=UPI00266FFB8C|nr:hydrogenase nickel incorporation protein HypB [uncultured Megamonas sp.]